MVAMTTETNPATATPGTKTRPRKRATRVGRVTSAGRDKTIRVTIARLVKHGKYGKYIRRRTHLHVHDEKNACVVGDRVEVMACRPLSKTKCWRLVRIVQAAPRPKAGEP
jgi:small subunit ribosomal protein S17